MKQQTATSKEVTVLAIYKFKTNGKLNGTRCYLVRNGDNKEYKVWTHANGCASSCDCEGWTKSHGRNKCYHIKEVERIEESRKAAQQPEIIATVQQDESTGTQPVVSVPAIAPKVVQAATAIVAMKTPPQVRNVSQDWLLKGSRSGAFSGRVA